MASNDRTVGLEQVQNEAFGALFRRFASLRLYIAPLLFLLILVAFARDPAPWRRWTVVGVACAALARAFYEYRRLSRHPFNRTRIPVVMAAAAPILVTVLAVTGGIDSPVWPMMVPLAVFLTLFGLARHAVALIALATAALWGMTWISYTGTFPTIVPHLFGGGARVVTDTTLLVARSLMLSFTLVWAAMIGSLMRQAFESMVRRGLTARDEVLQMHRESTQALTVMAGEIAHELKNPLTSVKGLAALVDRALQPKEQERMAVLRREVDRMQEILDSFLNFSRPLVPLDAATVALRQLCESVAALHEGAAADARVTLSVEAPAEVEVHADARKLKQVLINLVQNALDASPAGERIELVLTRAAQGATIRVCDRGAGLDPATRDRLFEPGVTTKPTGNGLGLTIARAIARQHGGELRLLPREGGGTVAELTVPAQQNAV